jgi:signal transduction histidine kinase
VPLAPSDGPADGSMPPVDPRLLTFATRLVPLAALVAIGAGAVALTGWAAGLDVLKRVVPGAASMKPNTAVCLMLLALGLWLGAGATPRRRRGAAGVCAVALVVALTTLVEYAAGVNLPVDRVLFAAATAADTVGGAHPGRPAPNTAAAFVLLGGAQVLLLARRDDRAVRTSQILSLAAAVVGLLGLYGYAFRVPAGENFLGLTGMAVNTAAVVTLIATATLFARPEDGLARVLLARGASAMLTRRMVLATAAVPPLIGLACLYGQETGRAFDTRLAVALLVAGNVIVFTAVSFAAGARAAKLEAARDHSELLLARHAQLQAVVDHLPAAVFMQDLQGRYALVNEAFETMRGDPATAARFDGYVARARTADRAVRFEQAVTAGPRPMTYLAEVFALRDPAGQPYAMCGVLTDITELRAREAELTAFAYEVAHDLRGPLTPIAGFARILAEDLTAGVREAELLVPNLERICRGVDRMESLIRDLLAYATARDGAIHPEPVDLQAMVAAIVAERTGHPRVADELKPDISTGPLPTVRADPVLCRQLLDNLIGNALKYTYPDHAAHIAISGRSQPDGWVRVDIADRGIGIPVGDQEQVFATFHRVATGRVYAGTGLGLAICRRVVDRHHGSIRVGDNPGGGSRFSFTLPGLQLTPLDADPLETLQTH